MSSRSFFPVTPRRLSAAASGSHKLRASGNRAPPHGGGASGGVVSSARDDDGGGVPSAMREQLSEEGPACITNTRHSTGLGRGHAHGRGSQDSTVDP